MNKLYNLNVSKVAILLATYNSNDFLLCQLKSFQKQTIIDWELWVSDDSDNDECKLLLKDSINKGLPNRVEIVQGPKLGATNNFFSLILNENIKAEYYALSDQDDIWRDDKLERALQCLKDIDSGMPGLYCSRTEIINASGKTIGFSKKFSLKPSFKNALVQSIAGGNTMVFNDSARNLIKNTINCIDVVAHDWWIYQIISGSDGFIFFDQCASVLYRQHENNLVGENNSILSQTKRFIQLLSGNFKHNVERNVFFLNQNRKILTEENKKTLDLFIKLRKSPIYIRPYLIFKLGLYRQTFMQNIALILAIILKRV